MKHKASELILNSDNSVYHLHLKNEHTADTVILVGDPKRVEKVSSYFDSIEFKIENREFITHTGYLSGKRLTVLSTGIGTDNIDIVLNEIDAAVNFDVETRSPKKELRKLNFIRLGTTGAIQSDIEIDSLLVSKASIGLDGLKNYYASTPEVRELNLINSFKNHCDFAKGPAMPYVSFCSNELEKQIANDLQNGITLTASGFYAPQTRILRLPLARPELFERYQSFTFEKLRITNFEMECSALYALAQLLGHEALTICAVIANRANGEFSKNHNKTEHKLIEFVLSKLTM
jgi:uridine phosphorylase